MLLRWKATIRRFLPYASGVFKQNRDSQRRPIRMNSVSREQPSFGVSDFEIALLWLVSAYGSAEKQDQDQSATQAFVQAVLVLTFGSQRCSYFRQKCKHDMCFTHPTIMIFDVRWVPRQIFELWVRASTPLVYRSKFWVLFQVRTNVPIHMSPSFLQHFLTPRMVSTC